MKDEFFIVLVSIVMLIAGLFSSCTYLPQIAEDAKEVLTDDCITLKVDRDAFQKDTDIKINLEVINKDVPYVPMQEIKQTD